MPLPSPGEIKGHACGQRACCQTQKTGARCQNPRPWWPESIWRQLNFRFFISQTKKNVGFYWITIRVGVLLRALAAADNLTKFLAEAAANHRLFVRDNESTVRAQPVRREENWEVDRQLFQQISVKIIALSGYYESDHVETKIDQ